jgi:hypothetical protein
VSFCFSYASKGNHRVQEAKVGLESRGHSVFYGLDVSAIAPEDWRLQWMVECDRADYCVNFLSSAYLRSQACADEWNHATQSKPGRVLNVMVGGAEARNALMAVPLDQVAKKGGAAIKLHFDTSGQAVSVYDQDDITTKILASLHLQ